MFIPELTTRPWRAWRGNRVRARPGTRARARIYSETLSTRGSFADPGRTRRAGASLTTQDPAATSAHGWLPDACARRPEMQARGRDRVGQATSRFAGSNASRPHRALRRSPSPARLPQAEFGQPDQ